jgi:transcription elongation factor GreA
MEQFHCSAQAHARLTAELARLELEVLPALRAEVVATRTDSLSSTENYASVEVVGEYERVESQARELRDRLGRATIIEHASLERAEAGTVVVLDLDGDEWPVLLGSIHEHGVDVDVVSTSSPLGAALLGLGVGDDVTWQTPGGPVLKARVVALRGE